MVQVYLSRAMPNNCHQFRSVSPIHNIHFTYSSSFSPDTAPPPGGSVNFCITMQHSGLQ